MKLAENGATSNLVLRGASYHKNLVTNLKSLYSAAKTRVKCSARNESRNIINI